MIIFGRKRHQTTHNYPGDRSTLPLHLDSISQFVLGAAIGELVAGRKAGNKAILWGGIAGTIPDLDILLNPFITPLQQLSVHRGYSHALLFAFVAAPLFAWPVQRLHHNSTQTSFKDWLLLFFLGIFTHPLLDAFTLYGTQLFLPFSDYRVALNTISIVDPLYTLPLLIGIIIAMIRRKKSPEKAAKAARVGLIISCVYLGMTCAIKQHVDRRFEQAIQAAHIRPNAWLSNPVLFSNLLWYTVTREDSTCHIGYYSLLQGDRPILFETFQRNLSLQPQIKDPYGLDRLRWFSKDFYLLEQQEKGLFFYDIRFGKTNLDASGENERTFVFCFQLPKPDLTPLPVKQYISLEDSDFGEFTRQIGHRILHNGE